MSGYQVLLVVHILASMLWLGGAAAGTLIGVVVRRSGTAAMAAFCSAFARVAGPLFGGSAMVVLITGIWMVAMDGFPEFDAIFVSVGFAGWFVSTLLGATIVGRSWYSIGVALEAPGADIATMGPAFTRALTWTSIDLAIRTAVVVVMVWQPI